MNILTRLIFQAIDLNRNKIFEIEQRSFAGLIILEILRLKNNRICSIEPLSFLDTRNLKYLDLSMNKLTNISFESFIGLQKVSLCFDKIIFYLKQYYFKID